jgi:hypothetical protein
MGAALPPSPIILRHDVSCLSRTNSRPIELHGGACKICFDSNYNNRKGNNRYEVAPRCNAYNNIYVMVTMISTGGLWV